jgi:lipopolysaccharide transport protein LptA
MRHAEFALVLLLAGAAHAQQTALTAAPVAAATTTTDSRRAAPAASRVDEAKERLTSLPSPQNLKPRGPVQISADRTELVQGSSVVLTGHANLVSDTLRFDGDRLDLKQDSDRQIVGKFTGNPAHMAHASVGPDDPSVTAHARTITYDSRSGIVDLVGNAFLDRSGDTTTAETIRYNLAEKRILESGGSGRVIITIQPPDSGGGAIPAQPQQEPGTTPPAPAPEPDRPAPPGKT